MVQSSTPHSIVNFDGSLDDNVPPPYKTFKLWNSPLDECKVEMIMLDIVDGVEEVEEEEEEEEEDVGFEMLSNASIVGGTLASVNEESVVSSIAGESDTGVISIDADNLANDEGKLQNGDDDNVNDDDDDEEQDDEDASDADSVATTTGLPKCLHLLIIFF